MNDAHCLQYLKHVFRFKLICFSAMSPLSRVVLPVSVEEVSVIIINSWLVTSACACFDTPAHVVCAFILPDSVFPLLLFHAVPSRSAVLCGWGKQERDRWRRRHRGSEERTVREGRREGAVHPQNLPSKEACVRNKLLEKLLWLH